MKHLFKRCRYCGREYTYQISGFGCHESTNDVDYCPECKAIINKALKEAVPSSTIIKSRMKDIDRSEIPEADLQKMLNYVHEEEPKKDYDIFPTLRRVYPMGTFGEYENVERFDIGFLTYYMLYNENREKAVFKADYEFSYSRGFIQPYRKVDEDRHPYYFKFERVSAPKPTRFEDIVDINEISERIKPMNLFIWCDFLK